MNDTKIANAGAVDSSALLAAEKEPDWEALKLALNNAVWMHAPITTTLAQAEEATCQAISYLAKCRNASNAEVSDGVGKSEHRD